MHKAALIAGRFKNRTYEWIEGGRLPACDVEKFMRVRRDDLDATIAALPKVC